MDWDDVEGKSRRRLANLVHEKRRQEEVRGEVCWGNMDAGEEREQGRCNCRDTLASRLAARATGAWRIYEHTHWEMAAGDAFVYQQCARYGLIYPCVTWCRVVKICFLRIACTLS